MAEAQFTFHDVLNHFLVSDQRDGGIDYEFEGHPAIKDAIEALGIPHTEVAAIMVDNNPVDFAHGLNDSDAVHVYPHRDFPSVVAKWQLPFMPNEVPTFILDVHLGKLARFMRTAGFDTLYSVVDMGDAAIAGIAAEQNRIVLSRDTGLLKRSAIRYGYWPRQTESREQFREVVGHYNLKPLFKAFSRCPHCNGEVINVVKEDIIDQLPGTVAIDDSIENFVQCHVCRQVYWQGSHYTHMQHFFDSID